MTCGSLGNRKNNRSADERADATDAGVGSHPARNNARRLFDRHVTDAELGTQTLAFYNADPLTGG